MFGTVSGRTIGLLLVALGLVLMSVALRVGLKTRAFAATATHAEGVVTRLNAGGSHPQVQFVTRDGKTVSYPQGGLIFGFQPGDKVDVLFDESDPGNTATVNAVGSLWFYTMVLSGLGLLLLIAGMLSWLRC